MINFFGIEYQELNSKIGDLSSKIGRSQSFWGNASKYEWDSIFELCNEISENFKNVRYPTKEDRDIAWQNFFNLRNDAHNIRREQTFNRSKGYYDEIMNRLEGVDYHAIRDFLIGKVMSLGLLKETKEDMVWKGKELGSIGSYFKSVKNEMIGEHKANVHERMIEVRQHHDIFWDDYKSYQEERSKLHEEKQRAWEEKQEKSRRIKSQIESNIEKNKEKLYKAKDALEHFERKKSDLQYKIYDSHSDNWRWKAEGWLDEFNDKISSIEDQIRRIEGWIDEDREKLRNWR